MYKPRIINYRTFLLLSHFNVNFLFSSRFPGQLAHMLMYKSINKLLSRKFSQELVKYSTRLGENCDDLQKALELMLGIPHRATDNKFISNIEGYKGNIHKLGRLLTHVSILGKKISK